MYFFSFCLPLAFFGRGIPCQSPTVVSEHSISIFLDISSPLKKCVDQNVLHVAHSLHHSSLGKNPNASEGSVFFLTRCSLNSGSSAKDCLQVPHSLEPFCFPKILLLQI